MAHDQGHGEASTTNAETESDENLLMLRPSTLSALNSFLDERAAAMEAMASLTAHSYPQNLTGSELGEDNQFDISSLPLGFKSRSESLSDEADVLQKAKPQIQSQVLSVDKYKSVFRKLAAQSILVYARSSSSEPRMSVLDLNARTGTAENLVEAIRKTCPSDARIAFVCCPTGFVAFRKTARPTHQVSLLEYDTRFSVLAGPDFVHYDLDEPLIFPGVDTLRNSQDIVVVDPPFHSEASQRKIASTVAHILRPGGRFILLTGLTLSPLINSIYTSPPLPILRRRSIVIEHDGVGRLETPYGCWVGCGADYDNEDGFGGFLTDEEEP